MRFNSVGKTYQHIPWQKSFHSKLSFKLVVSSPLIISILLTMISNFKCYPDSFDLAPGTLAPSSYLGYSRVIEKKSPAACSQDLFAFKHSHVLTFFISLRNFTVYSWTLVLLTSKAKEIWSLLLIQSKNLEKKSNVLNCNVFSCKCELRDLK